MVKGKKTFKKKPFNQKYCSPKNSNNTISCIDDDLLIKIANILNKFHKSNIKTSNKKTLHKQISDKLSKMSKCESESCWVSINEIIEHLSSCELSRFKNSFRPCMPKSWNKDRRALTSTTDLEKVLKQYEDCYSKFTSYGALPLDFDLKRNGDCVSGDLCNIDLNEHFRNNKTSMGFIFNYDEHDEPGSHWVSMYVDLLPNNNRDNPTIYFFDSVGDKPPKEIKRLIKNISNQYKDIKDEKIDYLYNDIQHQQDDSECGIYCLHFITRMLNGMDFDKYINKIKDDDYINKYRDFYYIR
tara:strand:+ start:2808 stop:3701 length:894 start_codon:yes stop_codon:yes gene_type:complete